MKPVPRADGPLRKQRVWRLEKILTAEQKPENFVPFSITLGMIPESLSDRNAPTPSREQILLQAGLNERKLARVRRVWLAGRKP
jgi:hypothetical protein